MLNIPVSVTFRSNDAIISQLYREGILKTEEVKHIRNDERNVIYIVGKKDDTIAIENRRLDNKEFVKLIQDDTVRIIF